MTTVHRQRIQSIKGDGKVIVESRERGITIDEPYTDVTLRWQRADGDGTNTWVMQIPGKWQLVPIPETEQPE